MPDGGLDLGALPGFGGLRAVALPLLLVGFLSGGRALVPLDAVEVL